MSTQSTSSSTATAILSSFPSDLINDVRASIKRINETRTITFDDLRLMNIVLMGAYAIVGVFIPQMVHFFLAMFAPMLPLFGAATGITGTPSNDQLMITAMQTQQLYYLKITMDQIRLTGMLAGVVCMFNYFAATWRVDQKAQLDLMRVMCFGYLINTVISMLTFYMSGGWYKMIEIVVCGLLSYAHFAILTDMTAPVMVVGTNPTTVKQAPMAASSALPTKYTAMYPNASESVSTSKLE